MRLNKYIAFATGISRRAADDAVYRNRVLVNGRAPTAGQQVGDGDVVLLDGQAIVPPDNTLTIVLHKPAGYICSRDGQGSRTIYDLLPSELHVLKPVGRLDKDSSGLLLMTTDGGLAHELTHPRYQKTKVYEVRLDKPLTLEHSRIIIREGVRLIDGISRLELTPIPPDDNHNWQVSMHEGRNRQIRRTFEALGYQVVRLHRTQFGSYKLGSLDNGSYSRL